MAIDDKETWLEHNPQLLQQEDVSLFQTGHRLKVKNELITSARLIERLNRPWEETVSLPDPREVIAYTFHMNDNDPLLDLLMDNEIVPITCADMFLGGSPDVVLSRVFYITNGEAIHAELDRHGPLGQEGAREWTRELFAVFDADFTRDGVFAAVGQIYVGDDAHRKNLLLYDGTNFRAIKHKEQTAEVDGFSSQDNLEEVVTRLNRLNATRYKGFINVEWVIKQPYYVIEETYRLLEEHYREVLGSFVDSAEHGVHADDKIRYFYQDT